MNTRMNTLHETPGEIFTEYLILNVFDLPDIFSLLAFGVFGTDLYDNTFKTKLISVLEQLSYITYASIKSSDFAISFCNALRSRNINDLENFIVSYVKKPGVSRERSMFRYDPKAILRVFLTHTDVESATNFMRYVLHSLYLPEMNEFLERYNKESAVVRDALVPKVVYSWYEIE